MDDLQSFINRGPEMRGPGNRVALIKIVRLNTLFKKTLKKSLHRFDVPTLPAKLSDDDGLKRDLCSGLKQEKDQFGAFGKS